MSTLDPITISFSRKSPYLFSCVLLPATGRIILINNRTETTISPKSSKVVSTLFLFLLFLRHAFWIFCYCYQLFVVPYAYPTVISVTLGRNTRKTHYCTTSFRFCAGSNPACGVSEIRDGEDLWQWSWLEIRINAFRRSTILQKQFIIIIILSCTEHL